jgi:hypothetical protein
MKEELMFYGLKDVCCGRIEEFIDLTPAMEIEEIEAIIAETPCPKDNGEAMRLAARILNGKKI